MATITNKILKINVSADTDRQAMIDFYEDISRKIPLFARKIHDHMKNKNEVDGKTTNPICARTRDGLSSSVIVQRNAHELPDGWVAHTHENHAGYTRILSCIGEALGIIITSKFNGTVVNNERKAQLRLFWSGLINRATEFPKIQKRTASYRMWFDVALGDSRYHLSFYYSMQKQQLGCCIWINNNKDIFDNFETQKTQIEQITGPLTWDRKDDNKSCKIGITTIYQNDDQAYQWFLDVYPKFNQAFSKNNLK